MKLFRRKSEDFKKNIYQNRWLILGLANLVVITILSLIIGGLISMSILLEPGLSEKQILAKFFPIIRSVRKLSDIIYLPYYFIPSKLPLYRLEIKAKDLEFLNKNLPPPYSDQILTSEYKIEVPAKFLYKGQEYKVEVRYRGQNSNHWSAPKRSWLIRFDEENLFEGRKEIDLILPFDRQFIIQHLANYQAKKLGIITPASRFVKLAVNGKLQGVLWEIEGWTKEMLERENDKSGDTDIFTVDWPSTNTIDKDYFDHIRYWRKQLVNELSEDDYTALNKFIDVISDPSDKRFFTQINEILDLDKFFRWQINHLLFDSPHGYGANIKIYFDKDTGKFEFIAWDVGQLDPPPEDFDLAFNSLVERLSKNPEFIRQRNKILWNYVKDDTNLNDDLAYYDNIYKKIKADIYRDRIKIKSNLQFDWEVKKRRETYINTHRKVQEAFREEVVTLNIQTNSDQYGVLATIDVQTESFPSFILSDLEFDLEGNFNQYNFGLYDQESKKIVDFIYDEELNRFRASGWERILTTKRYVEGINFKLIPTIEQFFIRTNRSVSGLEISNVALEIKNYFSKTLIEPKIQYVNQNGIDIN